MAGVLAIVASAPADLDATLPQIARRRTALASATWQR